MQDEKYMRLALELAQKARGKTSPNPMVGAVVVKNGKIVGQGFHHKAGSPHAEINAIKQAGRNAKGSTLYVSLEPCCFFGKTPPCTDAIIRAGIKKVVIGEIDSNPLNNGKGIKILKTHGIGVKTGVCGKEAKLLNEVFEKYITTGMPFVILKMAETLDGKIATSTGDSKWVSCEKSRNFVHKLRGQVDAVMVGANTARMDKPHLKQARVKVLIPSVKVDLRNFLKGLGRKQITSILCEGGGELAGSLIESGLVDKIMFFIAPKIIGGRAAKSPVEGNGIENMANAIKLKNMTIKRIGDDILVEAYVHRHN